MTSDQPDFTEEGITCQRQGGGLQIHLDAARRKPIVPMVLGFVLAGGAFLMVFFFPIHGIVKVPVFIGAGFSLFLGAVLEYVAIYNWLVSQDVTVYHDSILIDRNAPLLHWQRTFKAEEIEEVICKVDGQTKVSGNSGTTYDNTFYGIQIRMKDGKSDWLASSISNKDCADRLTGEINRILRLTAKNPQDEEPN